MAKNKYIKSGKTALQINSCNFASTGNIMLAVQDQAAAQGWDAWVSFPANRTNRRKKTTNSIEIGSILGRNIHLQLAKYTDLNGFFSRIDTYKFLKEIDKINPSIIHLHNLHTAYINLPMLFRYIKKNNIKAIWTLHDCWTFTGHCAYFDMVKCSKWESGCYNCPQYRGYPESVVDNSKIMYKLKKKWFTGVQDMTIVTPSEWLAGLVKKSFLKDYPVKVINNGINLSIFRPTESDFREKYNCRDKFILLGVAFSWGKRKGLDIFLELAKRLDDRFKIVLVGTNDIVDESLPENIISIHSTQSQKELAEIYSAADLFLNPTREDNYPTVNMEAIACGTPVVTFNTGGSIEAPDETCGSIVDCDDIDALEKEILRIYLEKPYLKESCLKRAEGFDMHDKFKEYVELYETTK